MNRIEIPEANFTADIPSSYSEMTRPQVFYVMQQMHALQCAKISQTEFHVRILYKLAGIKRTARSIAWERLHPAAAHRRAEKIVLLSEQLLGFLFTTNGLTLTPIFDTITNHLPTLRIGPTLLVGPGDGLMDISLGELVAADADLTLYTTTKDERYIDNMIARLYRRPGPMQPCGRKAEPFKMEETEGLAHLIRFLPGWEKQLILFWYSACIDNLQHGFFPISGREVSFEPLFNINEAGNDSLGWLSVQLDIAREHIFGNMAETAETNIIDVLAYLLNCKFTTDHVEKYKENN